MKKLFKQIAICVLGAAFITPVFAATSGGYYGEPKATNTNEGYFSITVRNYTPYTYTAQGVYYPSGKSEVIPLNTMYPYNTYTFVDRFPDNQVCISVIRDLDRFPVVNRCYTNGQNINIGPSLTANNIPVVKISQ
jgi:hypothetical protein